MLHNRINISIDRLPAENPLCFGTAPDQLGRISGPAVRKYHPEIPAGHPFDGIDDFQYRSSLFIPQIEEFHMLLSIFFSSSPGFLI